MNAGEKVDREFELTIPDASLRTIFKRTQLKLYRVEATNKDGRDGFLVSHLRYGHGLGVSQRGIQQMAAEGLNETDMLHFYFEGCSFSTIEYAGSSVAHLTILDEIASRLGEIRASVADSLSHKTADSLLAEYSAQLPGGHTLELYQNDVADAARVTGDTAVCTGMILKLLDSQGKLVATKAIVVAGDVDGDGRGSLSDCLTMVSYIIGQRELSPASFSAADLKSDGLINLMDVLRLVNRIIGTA